MTGRFGVAWRTRGDWPRVFSCLLGLLCLAGPGQAQRIELPFLAKQVSLNTSKPAYWRYELVELQAEAQGPGLSPADHPFLEVRFFQQGRPMPGLPGREACLLRYDPNTQSWRGRWPIPWNPELGEVEARLAEAALPGQGAENSHFSGPGMLRKVWVYPDRWSATCRFQVRGRQPLALSPGYCAVTLEPGARQYRLPGPEGGRRTATQSLAWAKMMEADAFWHCGLQTQIWPGSPGSDAVWHPEHLEQVPILAKAAKDLGLDFGAYMLTFLVGGDFQASPYEFTLAYDKTTDSVQPIRFVSMGDARRQRDIIAGIRLLENTPGVTHIGMDYVRANTGGLEFTDEFLADMDLDLPEGLRQDSVEARRRWLGRQLAIDVDRRLQHQWDWWRAHRVSLVLKGIFEEAKPTKPVWVFSLGWKQGHQHGQDPRMLIDAGISFNAPMFYEADSEQYGAMLSDWRKYLKHTGGVLMLGQVVDTPLLHPRPGLNGPEEHYQRQMEALSQLGPVVDRLGFFWHDVNRAVAGGRSPYGGREWAMVGATSFSKAREEAGALPLSLELTVTGTAEVLNGRLRVQSLAPETLAKVRVDTVWTPGLGTVQMYPRVLRNLAPGESRELTFSAQVTERFIKERYREGAQQERMVVFKAKVMGETPWTHGAFAFAYWKSAPTPELILDPDAPLPDIHEEEP